MVVTRSLQPVNKIANLANLGRYKQWTRGPRTGDLGTQRKHQIPEYRFFYNNTALPEAMLHCGTGF